MFDIFKEKRYNQAIHTEVRTAMKSQQIHYLKIEFLDDFPVYHFSYTQKYTSSIKMHYHNGLEIGLCMEGTGVFFIGDQVCPFKKGDIYINIPGWPHNAQSPNERPSQWNYITIDTDRFPIQLRNPHNEILSDHDLTELVRLVFSELHEQKEGYREAVLSLLQVLFIRLNRQENMKEFRLEGNGNLEMILPALNYLSQNYREDVSVCQMAKACNLSESHFRRVFKRVTKDLPLTYLVKIRLKMAAVLLESSERPIAHIAQEVGFKSLSSFNRQFQKQYQMTPRQWRNFHKPFG